MMRLDESFQLRFSTFDSPALRLHNKMERPVLYAVREGTQMLQALPSSNACSRLARLSSAALPKPISREAAAFSGKSIAQVKFDHRRSSPGVVVAARGGGQNRWGRSRNRRAYNNDDDDDDAEFGYGSKRKSEAMKGSQEARDTPVTFGNWYREARQARRPAPLLGSLKPRSLQWMERELADTEFDEWAENARIVLKDPVYEDRREWTEYMRLQENIGFESALKFARKCGWEEMSNIGAWHGVKPDFIGTSFSARIPRRGISQPVPSGEELFLDLSAYGGGRAQGGVAGIPSSKGGTKGGGRDERGVSGQGGRIDRVGSRGRLGLGERRRGVRMRKDVWEDRDEDDDEDDGIEMGERTESKGALTDLSKEELLEEMKRQKIKRMKQLEEKVKGD